MTNFTPAEFVVFTDFDDESGLLINTNTKRYYELNETGTFIWKRLSENLPTETVADALTENYEVSREQAAKSVDAFLSNLKAQGLIKSD